MNIHHGRTTLAGLAVAALAIATLSACGADTPEGGASIERAASQPHPTDAAARRVAQGRGPGLHRPEWTYTPVTGRPVFLP